MEFSSSRRSLFDSNRAVSAIAAFATTVAFLSAPVSHAHDGHVHGEAGLAVSGNAPQRLPDGSVFLPKPSQRQLNVRTTMVEQTVSRRAIELNARVVADPSASGKVQPTQAGRLEPARAGGALPALGDRVAAGQVLAVVRPSIGTVERAAQSAQTAEISSNLELARRKLARLEQLEGTVAQKEIDSARLEVQSLTERKTMASTSLSVSETLRAPVAGVISAVNAVAGQVLDAREVVFEIIDPTRLRIEATAFDPALPPRIKGAAMKSGDTSFLLNYVGHSKALRDGAIPIQFAVKHDAKERNMALPLVVGQSVTVYVATDEEIKGIRLPTNAVVKAANNQAIVWKHETAERFVSLPVTTTALDANSVVVTSGINPGARIVIDGASFVNQVR
jgi:membrane fusion protein, heavy metal efflux system